VSVFYWLELGWRGEIDAVDEQFIGGHGIDAGDDEPGAVMGGRAEPVIMQGRCHRFDDVVRCGFPGADDRLGEQGDGVFAVEARAVRRKVVIRGTGPCHDGEASGLLGDDFAQLAHNVFLTIHHERHTGQRRNGGQMGDDGIGDVVEFQTS
jgi:hypothetical protein